MRRAILCVCIALFSTSGRAENVVLMNGVIIDGTLKARFQGNIRIRDGRITDIGPFKPASDETVLDVKGLIVAPGFIDLQSRPWREFQKDPGAPSEITQGVTTALLGADGTGPYLIEDFMTQFDEKPPALNIIMLAGHDTIRRQIMGDDFRRPATPEEILLMTQLVESAMREGAFGLSSNLVSEPGSFGSAEEMAEIVRMVNRFGGVYMTHVRDVAEVARLTRGTNIPVQISHIRSAAALAEIDKGRTQKIDLAGDVHPYAESGFIEKELRTLLQHPWVIVASGGVNTFPRLLGEYAQKQKVLTLERAIRKITGLPALRLGLKTRGVLTKGASADVVVFDAAAAVPVMKYVFVNGTIVVKDGEATGERAGEALR